MSVCLSVCGYVQECRCLQRPEPSGPLELELQMIMNTLMWVLVPERRSSEKAASALSLPSFQSLRDS